MAMAKIKINVTKPISIPGEGKRTTDLKPGQHEVDESILNHWFIKSMISKKVIVLVSKKPKPFYKHLDQIEKKVVPENVANMTKAVTDETITDDDTGDSNKKEEANTGNLEGTGEGDNKEKAKKVKTTKPKVAKEATTEVVRKKR